MKPQASKENNFHYNKKLKEKANYLRNNATKAEACLWKYVLKSSLLGYPFRRQRPVLNYIADFMSTELMLIIEVDGITHSYEEVVEKDDKKQHDLEEVGFTVLRFSDDEVLNSINNVRETILGLGNSQTFHPLVPASGGKGLVHNNMNTSLALGISPSWRGSGGGFIHNNISAQKNFYLDFLHHLL